MKTKKAFTIIELLVAMAIIIVLLAGSGYVFHTAVKAERTARATAEIARKLRGITDQLDADFDKDNLRKDAEIFFLRAPSEIEDAGGVTVGYERFDQITFFTVGNFTPYLDTSIGKGYVARITYAIARNSDNPAETLMENVSDQDPGERCLARVQHFYTPAAPTTFPELISPLDPAAFESGERFFEYDASTDLQWKNAPIKVKEDAYSIITGVPVDINQDGFSGNGVTPVGTIIDKSAPGDADLHKIFCEGVGEFIIQHWDDSRGRWFPEIDVDGDGHWTGISDWPIIGGLLVIAPPDGVLYPGDGTLTTSFGRALKFTFTLYDSYGVFPEGKTFTHIIYLE